MQRVTRKSHQGWMKRAQYRQNPEITFHYTHCNHQNQSKIGQTTSYSTYKTMLTQAILTANKGEVLKILKIIIQKITSETNFCSEIKCSINMLNEVALKAYMFKIDYQIAAFLIIMLRLIIATFLKSNYIKNPLKIFQLELQITRNQF